MPSVQRTRRGTRVQSERSTDRPSAIADRRTSPPMRIALISDVHGNLPALEAVVADIRGRGVDLIANLGDTVSGPLLPRETAQFLMAARLAHHRRQPRAAAARRPSREPGRVGRLRARVPRRGAVAVAGRASEARAPGAGRAAAPRHPRERPRLPARDRGASACGRGRTARASAARDAERDLQPARDPKPRRWWPAVTLTSRARFGRRAANSS